MRRLALAALVLLATPAHSDAACHHYSIWHFPFPQRWICDLRDGVESELSFSFQLP